MSSSKPSRRHLVYSFTIGAQKSDEEAGTAAATGVDDSCFDRDPPNNILPIPMPMPKPKPDDAPCAMLWPSVGACATGACATGATGCLATGIDEGREAVYREEECEERETLDDLWPPLLDRDGELLRPICYAIVFLIQPWYLFLVSMSINSVSNKHGG